MLKLQHYTLTKVRKVKSYFTIIIPLPYFIIIILGTNGLYSTAYFKDTKSSQT